MSNRISLDETLQELAARIVRGDFGDPKVFFKGLKKREADAGLKSMRFLVAYEMTELWRSGFQGNFRQFLERLPPLGFDYPYAKIVIKTLPMGRIRCIGLHACVIAFREVKDRDRRKEALEELERLAKGRKTQLSAQRAGKVCKRYKPYEQQLSKKDQEIQRLLEENQELRALNDRLRKQIADLKLQIGESKVVQTVVVNA